MDFYCRDLPDTTHRRQPFWPHPIYELRSKHPVPRGTKVLCTPPLRIFHHTPPSAHLPPASRTPNALLQHLLHHLNKTVQLWRISQPCSLNGRINSPGHRFRRDRLAGALAKIDVKLRAHGVKQTFLVPLRMHSTRGRLPPSDRMRKAKDDERIGSWQHSLLGQITLVQGFTLKSDAARMEDKPLDLASEHAVLDYGINYGINWVAFRDCTT